MTNTYLKISAFSVTLATCANSQSTFQLGEKQISIGPLINPVLQSAALLLHLGARPHLQSAGVVQSSIFLIHSSQIGLHRGVGDCVGWPVH